MKITKEVIDLIKKGKSINYISNNTNFGKSTVYYHYKKIRGRKIRLININFGNNNELGEFLGIFSGDGTFIFDKNYHYRIRIVSGYYEKEYRVYLENKLASWFNKKPNIYYTKFNNKYSSVIFNYDSKEIYGLLRNYLFWQGKKTYSIKLKRLDINNKEFNIGFLRGLIDTDGSYYSPKRRLSFSTVSKELAYQVKNIIRYNLNINPIFEEFNKKDRAKLYTIALHGENAFKVLKNINPGNPNKNTVVI